MSPIERYIDQFLASVVARLKDRGATAYLGLHFRPPRFTWRDGHLRGRVLAYACDDGKVVLRFKNLPHKTPQRGVLMAPSREFSLVSNPDTFPDLAGYIAEVLFPRDPSAPAYPDGFLSLPAGCHLSRP